MLTLIMSFWILALSLLLRLAHKLRLTCVTHVLCLAQALFRGADIPSGPVLMHPPHAQHGRERIRPGHC